MIATKELTIGCYVKMNGKPYKVDEVFNNAVVLEKLDTLFHYSDLEPIPITKELPLMNGFVGKFSCGCYGYTKKVDNHLLTLYFNLSNTPNRDWYLHIEDCDRIDVGRCDIQYVHQVQTFCNVLGIELELKL